MRICNACRLPFDQVHPFDFMNDFTCFEMAPDPATQATYPAGYRTCRMNHTWREHVQYSYRRVGQFWFNRHYPVEVCPTCGSSDPSVKKLVQDDTCCEYGGPSLWDPCTDSWHIPADSL